MAENIQNIHIFITENQSRIWAIFHGGLMFAVCELREWCQNHNNRLLWKFWGPLSAPGLSRTKGVTGESKEVPGNGGVKAGHQWLKLGQTGTCLLGAHPSQNSQQRRTQQWMVLSQEVLIQTCHFQKSVGDNNSRWVKDNGSALLFKTLLDLHSNKLDSLYLVHFHLCCWLLFILFGKVTVICVFTIRYFAAF